MTSLRPPPKLDCHRWLPSPAEHWRKDLDALTDLLRDRRFVVLTGAGISTASGIPDYRGEGTRQRARNPIAYRTFCESTTGRQRYWSRAMLGYQRVATAAPNEAHRALADLERSGMLLGVITQNVDGLEQRAGSQEVVELHGNLREVLCLECGARSPRKELQVRLAHANPTWAERPYELAPDGDADAAEEDVSNFQVLGCLRCGGLLKPNVVFFGEGVDRAVVARASALVDGASALLVVGSSLAVFSGFRFVRQARAQHLPIAVVNIGETRADALCTVKVQGRASEVLPLLASRLIPGARFPLVGPEHQPKI